MEEFVKQEKATRTKDTNQPSTNEFCIIMTEVNTFI